MMRALEEIVTGARQGDLEAFGAIVERFQDMAVGYAYAILGDHDYAQDAAQQAFIQVYTNLSRLQDPMAFPAWFRKVVLSCCTRITRRRGVDAVGLDEIGEVAAEDLEPDRAYDRKSLREQVWAAIQLLPEGQRSALILYHIDGLSYKEIASFLSVPQSTVTNRLHAAKKIIKKELWNMVEGTIREMSVSGDDRFVRKVLSDVPKLGAFEPSMCPEDIPLPSVMRAVLRYLGEDYGWSPLKAHNRDWKLDNAMRFFAGVTGATFRFIWNPETWRFGGIDTIYMAVDGTQHFARAFEAAGYDHELLLSEGFAATLPYSGECFRREEEVRSRIVESIRDRNRPVVALGVVASGEHCVVTGYDEEGAVLVGWSYFQDEPQNQGNVELEPCGYFRKRDWYRNTSAILLIGGKRSKPPQRAVYRQALEWGLELLCRRAVGGLAVGWASYEDWAQRFLTDEDWSTGEATGRRRLLEPVIWELAERRWYGEVFLEQMWESDPALPDEPLRAAAMCFHAEHDMMWQIADLGLKGDDVMANLKDAGVRRQIADIILAARDKDIEAATHLERALSKSGW